MPAIDVAIYPSIRLVASCDLYGSDALPFYTLVDELVGSMVSLLDNLCSVQ